MGESQTPDRQRITHVTKNKCAVLFLITHAVVNMHLPGPAEASVPGRCLLTAPGSF